MQNNLTFHPLEGTWYNSDGFQMPATNSLAKKLGEESYRKAQSLNNKICGVLLCLLALLFAGAKLL